MKNKNKHSKQRLIGILIAIIGIAAGVAYFFLAPIFIPESQREQSYYLLFVPLALFIIGVIWYRVATSNSRKVCNACGGKMKGCRYEWHISSQIENDKYGMQKAWVDITATCPTCGAQKPFCKRFSCPRNGNLSIPINNFCRSHFE